MEANNRSVSRGRGGVGRPSIGEVRPPSTSRDSETGIDPPRGRDNAKVSTGRGGAGNIMRSPSRDIEPESRGHINSADIAPKGYSSGRGGAGNIRSPSRDPKVGPEHTQTSDILSDHANSTAEYERDVIQKYAEARNEVHVTGRGGLGNISRSRSRSKGPALHSTGRGGAGNIQPGDPDKLDANDDRERSGYSHTDGIHSTGRGGAANLTAAHGPSVEVVQHHEAPFESSGRGGAGNIRDRSRSREPTSRSASKDKNPITHLWNKATHPHPHQHVHTEDPNAIPEAPGKEGGE